MNNPPMIPHIFVTRQIPENGLQLLRQKGYVVTVYPEDRPILRKELLAGVKGCTAILSLLTDRIDETVLEAAGPELKISANYAVGFDNIDLEAAKKRRVIVTNTPCDEVNESVAEHTFTLMLGLARRLTEADAQAKTGKYQGWSPTLLLGMLLQQKTLGIIGLGRIGKAVAKQAVKGLGMHCIYYSHKPDLAFEKEYKAEYVPKEKLLEQSDIISLHLPLLPSTRHFISTEEFALMKKTAFLLNTARGPIVDEKALLRALRTNRIAGAGLDVFECEPAIDCDVNDRLELKSFPNVILTPHIGSATKEAREAMSRVAAENIIAVLEGNPAPNPAQ